MAGASPTQVFDTNTLQSLQPSQHLELLDVIDQLRAEGLNEHVDLPQLIVVGDQSSGKSSLLSAISGVPFPKKDNLCTRFATEVVLRRDDDLPDVRISVTITPSSTRSHASRSSLDAFARELRSMADLPDTMAEAASEMGLNGTGSAFAADILRLEVRGPRMPQLTIVDLPGLVHAENKFQSADDIELVNTLVGDYMAQERSIILAVVSAKNDYANQIVLTKTRKVDPHGRRTLGIITKPDTLYPGSAGESSFLDLARNQDVKFSLGWHVMRNPDSNASTETDAEALERDFFRTSRMGQIDASHRGIASLRTRLSEVLFQQIKRELPSLMAEIHAATDQTRERLERMGRSRVTPTEKRLFVMDLGRKYHTLCFAACEGLYEDPFFAEHGSSKISHRLRAVIQNANADFGERMLRAPLHVPVDQSMRAANGIIFESSVLRRANQLVHSYRGKELPGTFNPALIGQLFRELSRSWATWAHEHISTAWVAARTTVVAILSAVAEPHVRDACLRTLVDPALERMQRAMAARLKDYLGTFERHPITYNHYLTENAQKIRGEREREASLARCRRLFGEREDGCLTIADLERLVNAVLPKSEPNMDALAAQNLADYAAAYYKVAIKRVIDEIPAHIIEPALLTVLPDILDPSRILEMSEATVEAIGGESDERRSQREILKAKLEVFDRSSLICRMYAKNAPNETPDSLDEEYAAIDSKSDSSVVEVEKVVEEVEVRSITLEVPAPAPAPRSVTPEPTPAEDLPAPEPADWDYKPSSKKKKGKRSGFDFAWGTEDTPRESL